MDSRFNELSDFAQLEDALDTAFSHLDDGTKKFYVLLGLLPSGAVVTRTRDT